METKKFVRFLISGLTLSILSPVFCYGYANETTHPALTKETIELFNYYYPDLEINNKETLFIKEGSKKEDSPEIRCVNHFYDPIHNIGLLNVNFSAKNWSQNTRAQAGFNFASVGTIKDYFGANSDYSWDRAVYEYAWGDKERGLEALGHVLHLIQDMSVPPHVRNDQHMTDSSPYEIFTKDFSINNIYDISKVLINEREKPVDVGSLNNYFYRLAGFTNKNFFSESTLPDKNSYANPIINFENSSIGYGGEDNHKLVNINRLINNKGEVEKIIYSVYDSDELVLTDYWNILSKQAVLHGAGVVKLFFDEVEKEKKTHALYDLNKSFAKKIKDGIVNIGKGIATNVYSTLTLNKDNSKNLGLVTRASDNLTPEFEKDVEKNQIEEVVDNTVDNELINGSEPVENSVLFQENSPDNQDNTNKSISKDEQNQDKKHTSASDQSVSNQTTTNVSQANTYAPGFGGGGAGTPVTVSTNDKTSKETDGQQENQQETSTTTENSLIINSPIIKTPADNQKFTENSIIFSGLASSTDIIYSDFNTVTTSADGNDGWSLLLEDLEQGSTTIKFFATNKENTATSSQTSIEIFVDSRAPEIFLSVNECENSLSETGCLLATSTAKINANWYSDDEDFSYFILNENGQTSTTTATSTQISLSNHQTYTLSVSAVDNMGNESEKALKTIELMENPVVINEIAWMGTSKTTANDEWIELYNNTDHEISLDNWTLRSEDNTPYVPLSGTIPAKGYYLMERTDDDTVSDIEADLIYTGALSNKGEHLFLSLFDGNATTTVDEVYKSRYWNQKGNRISYITMEKYNPLVSGTDWDNWNTAMYKDLINGKTSEGKDIKGTPKKRNSVNYLITNYGNLNSDKTLTKENSPYIITNNNFEIKDGATLNIEEGVVIKFVPGQFAKISVKGSINSQGTSENPVVFTSLLDDEYAGDTNMDGICEPVNASSTSACPSAGNWKQIIVEEESQGASFDNTVIRYGGFYEDGEYMKFKGMLTSDGADIVVMNSIFENSKSRGLFLINVRSGTKVVGNMFRNNNYERALGADYPFGLDASGEGFLVKDNLFEDNVYGADIHGSAVIESNIFNGNTKRALYSVGENQILNNSGSGNGLNGIVIEGNLTSASSTNTLRKNDLPYLIYGSNIYVVASSTLTIDPGVVMKFADKNITVKGNLIVNGSDSAKVLFTSLDDDSDGVDAQNNGPAKEINVTNKRIIYLKDGSISDIKNAEFRYFYHALDYENSVINLENVKFSENEWAIYADQNSVVQTTENIIFKNNISTSTIPLF